MSIPSGNQSLNCQQQLGNQQRQLQQQMNHKDLCGKSPSRTADPVYQPGMGAQQLTWYMHQQLQKPKDNNIEFWRKFVAEFFSLNAKKRWCVSLYGSSHQTSGVIPQDSWHCEICNIKPSSGFETTADLLPRLFQIKYDSGTLEELLYVDMPDEYQNPSGHIILLYAKAIQQCIFEQLRIVRDGQLRIVFTPDLKIYSWEFCARNHEERIPRRIVIPQVGQLGEAAQKYQAAAQNTTSSIPMQELQSNCNMFVTSAHQLAKALEVPLVNDLGYPKRYVRCLQIAEVLNCMTDLINYSRENGTGATVSLGKLTQRTSSSSPLHVSGQQTEGQHQQISGENINNDCNSVPSTSQQQLISGHISTANGNSVPANSVQLSTSNNVRTMYDSLGATFTSTSATAILGLPSQNCTNTRNDNPMNYQNPSTGPSILQPTSLLYPHAHLSPLIRSSASNPCQISQSSLPEASPPPPPTYTVEHSSAHVLLQQFSRSNEADPNESMSSVEKIIREVMALPRFIGMGNAAGVVSVRNNQQNTNQIMQLSSNFHGSGAANNNMDRQ